jgi:hypothetical protein
MDHYPTKNAAQQEVAIAICKAKLKASGILPLDVKEPYDYPLELMPFAHAAFELLADAALVSGHELDYWEFLRDALSEAIGRATLKM